MAIRWRCEQGHETAATVPPPACPVCGETVTGLLNGDGPSLATIDIVPFAGDLRVTTSAEQGLPEVTPRTLAAPPATGPNVEIPGYEILGKLRCKRRTGGGTIPLSGNTPTPWGTGGPSIRNDQSGMAPTSPPAREARAGISRAAE